MNECSCEVKSHIKFTTQRLFYEFIVQIAMLNSSQFPCKMEFIPFAILKKHNAF